MTMLPRRSFFVRAGQVAGALMCSRRHGRASELAGVTDRLDRARADLAEAEAETGRLYEAGADRETLDAIERHQLDGAVGANADAERDVIRALEARGARAAMVGGRLYVDVRRVAAGEVLCGVLAIEAGELLIV